MSAISQRPKLEESTLLSRIAHRNTWSKIPIAKSPRERRLVQSLHSRRPLPINLDIDRYGHEMQLVCSK